MILKWRQQLFGSHIMHCHAHCGIAEAVFVAPLCALYMQPFGKWNQKSFKQSANRSTSLRASLADSAALSWTGPSSVWAMHSFWPTLWAAVHAASRKMKNENEQWQLLAAHELKTRWNSRASSNNNFKI